MNCILSMCGKHFLIWYKLAHDTSLHGIFTLTNLSQVKYPVSQRHYANSFAG
ncbi:hypothetical protein H1P_340013 [Hyella patelloides LEGE 07179]|uniref:Uncharacterized protein n=1 Tax=Hyella patelloides LEGE 07179 TaxID=945734 RepID=A0A563VVR0_9CYAN|nr:hypothetical protein H1P_340013 [Hyella patelloides LEGE 07179]